MPEGEATLLIGGDGFFGTAIAQALASTGHEVHVLSRHSDSRRQNGISIHQGNQNESDVVAPLLDICQTVIHLASTTNPGSSARAPLSEIDGNVFPAVQLMEIMSKHKPKRLIFTSSGGAVYGNPQYLPVKETQALQPHSYYAAGKAALESLFTAYAHSNDVPLTILRPSNLYGPGQQLRRGFGLVRTLFEKCLKDEPIEIWGDGHNIRDYLFINDAIEAVTAVLNTPDAVGAFNIGSGDGVSVIDLISLVQDVTGRELKILNRAGRRTDVKAIVLDTTKIHTSTGWEARTNLSTGLKSTWDWILEKK